jgi:predicted nucleic acid binding AN1-type Zn finger protein
MAIQIDLEEFCTKCEGCGEYWCYEKEQMLECDCVDGLRPSEQGEQLLALVKKYLGGKL